MSVELYIWYESLPEAQAQVQAAFAALVRVIAPGSVPVIPPMTASDAASAHAVTQTQAPNPRLLKRADRVMRNGHARDTWMEIWPVPDSVDQQAFSHQLQGGAVDAGFGNLALGGRHIEPFEDRSPRSTPSVESGSSHQA